MPMRHQQDRDEARVRHRHGARPSAAVRSAPGAAALMLTCLLLAITFLLLSVLHGHAATFKPPQGCRLEVTVQNRGCTVSQYYRCSNDPRGDQRSAIFDQDGLTHLSRIDAETRWIESSDPETGLTDRLVEEAEDHASFRTLLETGEDDFDFWTLSSTGERLHHVGRDELTGQSAIVDGIELEKTRFELVTTDAGGEVLITREGQQFINRAMGRFFGGIETQQDWTGQNLETDDSPMLFSFPGEDGFGATTPQFDCDQLMTSLPGRGGAT